MNVQRMHEVLAADSDYCAIEATVSWSDIAAIRRLYDLKSLKLVDTMHHGNWYHIEYEHKDSTCTYNSCFDLEIDRHAHIHLTVWDGDNVSGHRTNKRETYVFAGVWFYIAAVHRAVENAFTRYVTNQLDEEDAAAFEKRVEERSHKLLEIENE